MGTDEIPSFEFLKNHLQNKTFLTKQMLKKNILATNMVYINIFHDKNNLIKYEKVLDRIFFDISNQNISEKLKTKVCYKPINRIN